MAIVGVGGGVWALTAGEDKRPAAALAPDIQPKAEGKQGEDSKRANADASRDAAALKAEALRIEAAQRDEMAKEEQLLRLMRAVDQLEKQTLDYRAQFELIVKSEQHPDYDAKVLADAIAKIDAERLAAEEENDLKTPSTARKLTLLKARRDELVRRLRDQESKKSEQTFRLEIVKCDMMRMERLATELRERLEYLKLDLAPPQSSMPAEPTLERLVKEVAELKVEVRKLAEAKK